MRAESWLEEAACKDASSAIFFGAAGPVSSRNRDKADNELLLLPAAKAFCDRCPVSDACLEYALATRSEGIWAGTTTMQRRRHRSRSTLVVQLKPPPKPAPAERHCKHCGAPFVASGGRQVFCTWECRDVQAWREGRSCRNCERSFEPHDHRQFYCSASCADAYRNEARRAQRRAS